MLYNHLKSGTDIRGVASDILGKEVDLTLDAVYDITSAFVVWYCNKFSIDSSELKIAVGHDSRITGESISKEVIRALINSGVTVLDCGLASTPAMFMTTVELKTNAAIEITASHHPSDRNGLKFFLTSGGLDSKDISEIIEIANRQEEVIPDKKGEVIPTDFMKDYAASLRRMICKGIGKTEEEKPLKDYKIVVDAGNGVGGFYAKEVLENLGAETAGSKFLNPDGMFPNHIPNPENEAAMKSICEAVENSGADLGIIFDTDVDRAGCVDSKGNPINRNRLIALAAYIASRGRNDAVIVTDSVTSEGLHDYIENHLGCTHFRYRRGYKNIINMAHKLVQEGKDCPLAIETSGHAALKENYFLDDGAYLVTKIVIELAKGNDIAKILEPLKMPAEELEIRININAEDFKAYGENVIKEFEEMVDFNPNYIKAKDNREGIRVKTKNGCFILRLSVHDPVMPMNFESEVKGGIKEDIEEIKGFFQQFSMLDISSLNNI